MALPGLLDTIRSPLGGGLINLIQGWLGNRQFERFRTGEAADYNQYLRENAESLGPIGNTTGMASDLYANAQRLAGGVSNQATADVNRRFDALRESGLAGLSARGYGGGGVGSSLIYANERNRSDELRRVRDERLRMLLGVEETFGGGEIAANQEAERARRAAQEARLVFPPRGPNFATIQPPRS